MQGELFKISGAEMEPSKGSASHAGWLDRFQIRLRLDHLSILAILSLVLYVLVFSFGVEKGKRFALEELRAAQTRQEEIVKELTHEQPPPPTSSLIVSQDSSATTPLPEKVKTQVVRPLGRYTIQLITFKSRSRAEKEVERLQKMGYQSFVIPSGKFFQVCVEAFESSVEAREKLGRLQSKGFASSDAFIRPSPKPTLS